MKYFELTETITGHHGAELTKAALIGLLDNAPTTKTCMKNYFEFLDDEGFLDEEGWVDEHLDSYFEFEEISQEKHDALLLTHTSTLRQHIAVLQNSLKNPSILDYVFLPEEVEELV